MLCSLTSIALLFVRSTGLSRLERQFDDQHQCDADQEYSKVDAVDANVFMFLHFRHKVGGADVDKVPGGERDQKVPMSRSM